MSSAVVMPQWRIYPLVDNPRVSDALRFDPDLYRRSAPYYDLQNLPLSPDHVDRVIGCMRVMRNLPPSAGGQSSGRFRTSARAG